MENTKRVKKKDQPDPSRFYGSNPESFLEKSDDPEFSHVAQQLRSDPETETPNTECFRQYEDLVGETPLVDLSHLFKNQNGCVVKLYAKCEFVNPGFSIKDRIVENILDEAEAKGLLVPGKGTVVAASSGNTGAATAMFCAMRGYQCIITTCSKCSKEKQDAIRAYGAKLIVSPPGVKESDPLHYMNLARTLCADNPGWFDINQYDTQDNPRAHERSLGPEIWSQTSGAVTHFVAAGSTGGTITGVGRCLKKIDHTIRVVLGDPVGSIFTNYFKTGELGQSKKFLVEGVGKGSIPGAMDFAVIDEVIPVTDEEAFNMCHSLCRTEGLCVGGSGGLNVCTAIKLGEKLTQDAVIVTVLPDLGVKYLSKIYNPEWLAENNISISQEQSDQLITRLTSPEFETPPPAPSIPVQSVKYCELIGNTPMIDLSHLLKNPKCPETKLLAKCEFFNPGFSIKDRIIRNIFNRARAEGLLSPGSTVVAASSGNTGAATAMMCAMYGYKCIIITSPKCSQEKMDAVRAYGAELLVSKPGAKEGSPDHYMELARKLKRENPTWFDVDQYDNAKNPEGHYLSLGPEVVQQTFGTVSHFVAAGSTGGTISGTGKYLKEINSDINVVLADPVGSIFTNYFKTGKCGTPCKFLVEGVGKGSIPGAMDFGVVDDVCPIADQEAFDMCAKLSRNSGLCVGGSGGLNVCAATKVAESLEKPGVVVTVLPDLGVKYLSKIYNNDWLVENGISPPETSPIDGNLACLDF